MPASEHILALRSKIGHDLLLQPSALCLIRDDAGGVLLLLDAGIEKWTLPGGGIDPMEAPAQAARREAYEETGLIVEIESLAGVFGGPDFLVTYANGDQTAYVAIVFEARAVGGELRPLDGEARELRYFQPEDVILDQMGDGSRTVFETLILNTPERSPFYRLPEGRVDPEA